MTKTRIASIALLVIGAIAFFLLMPFDEPKPANLYLQFTEGFDNEKVEIKIDGNIFFDGKVKSTDAKNLLWYPTYIGKNHKAEITIHRSPFLQEHSTLKIKMEKPEVWVLVSQDKEDLQKWTSFEFRYEKPVR